MTERTPEQESAYRAWKDTAKCDVCGKEGIVGVYAMPFVPASFAYCAECLKANAHPYGMILVNTALIGGLDETQAHPDWVAMVWATVEHLGKTREQFYLDLAVEMREYERYMADQEAELHVEDPNA